MDDKNVVLTVITAILILTIASVVASADDDCSIESDRKAQSTDDLLSYRINDIIGDKPVFLFFYADWCHFCHQQMLIIDELEKEYAEEFGVRALPTMFAIPGKNEGGYVKQEISGFTEKERLKEIVGYQHTEVEPHREFYVQSEETSEGCTLGVASGHVTADGRPIFCKVRDTDEGRQQLCYTTGSPYDYIGVRSEGGGIFMGMNEAGVATGNSLVKLTPGDAPNSPFQRHILENYDTLDQIRDYVQSEVNAGTCSASGCFAFIDADGDASIFEVNRADWFMEYDSMDPDREAQGIRGFVVRANEFHQRSDGTDNTGISGRYESGTNNILGLIGIEELSARTITHGNDYANDFEFVRYGPGRTLSEISRSRTRSAIVVHGVATDEDPELATMWVILGQSNYGIAVPTWVKVSDIPQCLSSGDMYDRAKSLYSKGNEATTQASIFPVEAHIFDVVVNTFLPHWRTEGVPSVAEMTRIEHQIASDAYSLLDCLDTRQSDNKAPHVTFNSVHHGLTVDFTLIANDPDGTIEDTEWNFGDGQTSTETSPSHTYTELGTYLVSCTVTDDDGVSITDWKTETISAADGGTTISIADANAQLGCSTTTQITINNMTNFGAATVTLSYDHGVVHITSVAAGTVGTPIANIDNTTGTATIAAYVSTVTGPDSPITFANLELHAVGTSGDTSPLTLGVTTFTDADGASVSAIPKSGVFTIGPPGLRGDANDDGVVNVVDAMFVAQYAVGNRDALTLDMANADANLDGTVDVVDAMFIAQYAVGARTW